MALSLELICSRTWEKRSSSPKDETREREWYSTESSELVLRSFEDRLELTETGLGGPVKREAAGGSEAGSRGGT